jgi:hypothetical protein
MTGREDVGVVARCKTNYCDFAETEIIHNLYIAKVRERGTQNWFEKRA